MKILAVAILSAISFAGCATAEQRAKADDDYCRTIGAQPGTPIYVECRLRRDDRRAAAVRAAMADGPTVCNMVGGTMICN